MFESAHFLVAPRDARQSEVVAFLVYEDNENMRVLRSTGSSPTVQMEWLPKAEARLLWSSLRQKGYEASEKPWGFQGFRSSWSVSGWGLIVSGEAQGWVDRLYQNYHPCGYGTHAKLHSTDVGVTFLTYSRSTSCD